MVLAGIPYAFADILEIALPLLLVQGLHASLAWPSGIFVANTVMVIALQLVVVVRFAKWPHRTVLFWSGLLLRRLLPRLLARRGDRRRPRHGARRAGHRALHAG